MLKPARKPDTRELKGHRKVYMTKRWREYRARYIIDHPFCKRCERKGRDVPTYAVDHIKRVESEEDPLFWEPGNHQPLCKRCHAWKIAKYDGGFGNRRKEYHENVSPPRH